MGNIVYKEGFLVIQENIAEILNMLEITSIRKLCATLGHKRYYRRFIWSYAKVVSPLKKLLCKDTKYIWNP
jgi:hypothetical protein